MADDALLPSRRKRGRPRIEDFDAPKGDVARLRKSIIVAFIDEAVKKNERGAPFKLVAHQREILELAFAFGPDGKLPWDTIVYACPKKSGKSTINAAVSLAWAFTQEPPNEIYALANDQEQAKGRVYAEMTNLIRHNGLEVGIVGGLKGLTLGAFDLTTGTIIRAIASDAPGAAGSNHGFVSFDELWGYVSARSQRLWDEMTPVPTRRNSVRFISTYAGYENESMLLWRLYMQGVDRDEHPDAQGERLHPTLPIYGNRAARLFVYWDHEPRLPWQTPAYYVGQRRTLALPAYLRLHENRWVSARTVLITEEQWRACESPTARPVVRDVDLPVVIGADAATKKDTAALAAVTFDPIEKRVRLVNHAVFIPGPKDTVDLEATMEATLVDWNTRYQVLAIVYDPYQFIVIAKHLEELGMPVEEFPQTTDRLTAMSTTFLGLVRGRNLVAYVDETLRGQVANAVAVESARGIRIAKEKARNKIDVVVALAMAAHRAVTDLATGLPLYVFTPQELDAATEETADELQGVTTPEQREQAKLEAERALETRQARELWNNPNAWR